MSDHQHERLVPVYSVGKVFTAAAALLRFDREDTIGTHLSVPRALSGLAIGEILAHRSGLDDYFGWADYREAVHAGADPWPEEEVISRAQLADAGEFRYSNIGYLLIRRALEQAHGDHFFGMLNSTVLSRLEVEAYPFTDRTDWRRCAQWDLTESTLGYHPGWVYPGTFTARIGDAARGLARIMQGALGPGLAGTGLAGTGLAGTGLADAMRRTRPVNAPGHALAEPGYGLGLMTSGNPATVVGHGGGGPGFTVFAACTSDGARWHGEAVAAESDDRPLIERCLAALSG